ncbi:helix-turn-helix domain-containing protein [Streptomyces sp. STCH 565 A]|uniref:helix-turn-helix domain-containing protein n=1 Tax=Streptomyces sp. STCH 565 A TaxID=2950532 RepID=UPI002074E4AC|nr:helix-turn-helix domain-containing protein [Streptomyces sp. STCH 565 A]MCM8552272.1 helix-turn-helix domain-containing protein [Streptomyces sp. STCH 565 A]
MNTTTAATQANVTVATIRTWCRNGVVTAIKQADRWVIDSVSLARRIEIGARRMTALPPMVITSKTSIPGVLGVVGPATQLAAAFKAGTPITLGGTKVAGEQVYLGYARTVYDDGMSVQVQGLDSERGEHADFPGIACAVYLVDMTRLDGAPTIKATVAKARARSLARAAAVEQHAARYDARITANTSYDC